VVVVEVAVAVAVAVVVAVAVWRQIVNAAIHVRGPALCQSHKPCAWRYGLYHLHGV
jgi:pyruvate/2-oxoacid:ferredoxin oxidoreductase beta subunit